MNKKSLISWIPAILIMLVIYMFSSVPSNSMPSFGIIDLLVKKGGHMLGYGLLTYSFLFGLNKVDTKTIRISVIFAIFYALTDEWHQSYVFGRNGSLWDVGIDGLGSLIAIWINYKFDLFGKCKL